MSENSVNTLLYVHLQDEWYSVTTHGKIRRSAFRRTRRRSVCSSCIRSGAANVSEKGSNSDFGRLLYWQIAWSSKAAMREVNPEKVQATKSHTNLIQLLTLPPMRGPAQTNVCLLIALKASPGNPGFRFEWCFRVYIAYLWVELRVGLRDTIQ